MIFVLSRIFCVDLQVKMLRCHDSHSNDKSNQNYMRSVKNLKRILIYNIIISMKNHQ